MSASGTQLIINLYISTGLGFIVAAVALSILQGTWR